jgi:arylsulfatase A-like enzyme
MPLTATSRLAPTFHCSLAGPHPRGSHLPFIARWPGRTQAGTKCEETICHTNLIATCAEIVGAKLPDDAGEDSFSILPLLEGKRPSDPTHPAEVHQAADGTLAIRRGKWKLVLGTLAI